MQTFGDDPEIDGAALGQNFISITPVKCDMTDYRVLEDLRSWGLKKMILTIDPPEAEIFVDVALRGVGATTLTSRRLCSVNLISIRL